LMGAGFYKGNAMFLSSGQKQTAKEIAADRWNFVNHHYAGRAIEERKQIAIEQIEEDIFQMRRSRSVGSRKGFGSIFTSLIISLMVRLAMKWIERWIEKKLFEVRVER